MSNVLIPRLGTHIPPGLQEQKDAISGKFRSKPTFKPSSKKGGSKMPKKGGQDKGFYGHYNATGPKPVKNPSTSVPHKQEPFMGKVGNNNILGPVGPGAPIDKGDRS